MIKIRNPIADFDTPDPFVTYDKNTGYYYALFTVCDRIEIYRSRHAANIIRDGESRVIYTPDGDSDGIYGMIWAPEMHKGTNGKWYIYTSGLYDPSLWPKRLFILEADTPDPFGPWHFKCKPMPDTYAIDPTVYTHTDGKQYVCYSLVNKEQVLEIREMTSPYSFGERSAIISRAEYDWELVPPYVDPWTINEGAFFVKRGERLFIIYSANGCFIAKYALGVLEYVGGDLCDAASWKKHEEPIFTYGNGVYAPGHASFFDSPDGSEIWCAYHGVKEYYDKLTESKRFMHIQRFDFDDDGYPIAAIPVGEGVETDPPSGECE